MHTSSCTTCGVEQVRIVKPGSGQAFTQIGMRVLLLACALLACFIIACLVRGARCLLTSPWIWRVEVSLLKSTRSRLFPPSSHGVCARGGAPCCLVLLTSIMHNADTPGVCSAQRVARLGEAGRRVPGKGEHTGAVRRGCSVWRCTAAHGRL